MYKKIRSFPAHIFLIPLFFILHKLNEYFFLISIPITLQFTVAYLLLSAVLLLLFRLMLFRSINLAALLTTVFLIIFYLFGAVHDLLKNTGLPAMLVSYKLLLSLIGIIMILTIFYLKRSIGGFRRLHDYLNILFGFLLVIEVIAFLFRLYNHEERANSLARYNRPAIQSPLPKNNVKPDIFFIVFDEYSSTVNLNRYFNYNNTGIDSILRSHHFYLASNAHSNYNATPFSLATTFNMDLFDLPLERSKAGPKLFLQGWTSVKQSALTDLLENNGYTICNYGLCDLGNNRMQTADFSEDYQTRLLFEETLWGRIEKDILWNAAAGHIPLAGTYFNWRLKRWENAFLTRNMKNLQLTVDALNKQEDRPKFVFSHIMMPHGPYFLDRNGNRMTHALHPDPDTSARLSYLEQIMYSNKWIAKMAAGAGRQSARPTVVIIEGDHGYRDGTNNMPRESYFMNLNTYYFSDGDYSMLYDSISPVNSFRVVLNKYFKTNLPLVKDSTVYLLLTEKE
jgi:hypothetical protein